MKGRNEENSGVDWSTVQSIMKMPRPRGGKSLWNGIRGMVWNFRMFIAGEAERRQVWGRQGGYERIQGRKELETPETGDADKSLKRTKGSTKYRLEGRQGRSLGSQRVEWGASVRLIMFLWEGEKGARVRSAVQENWCWWCLLPMLSGKREGHRHL